MLCSTGAWHTLRVRGQVRLLVPLLVTGCKIWHLRAAGRFYPKMAWLSTIQKLPNGSQVRPANAPESPQKLCIKNLLHIREGPSHRRCKLQL